MNAKRENNSQQRLPEWKAKEIDRKIFELLEKLQGDKKTARA